MEEVRNYSVDEFGIFLTKELCSLNEYELVVLKGHIFTEFALNCWLEEISTNNKADFFNQKFRYITKVELAILFGNNDELSMKMFDAIKTLNNLRNSIAHKLYINKHLIPQFCGFKKN